ncbi:MAG: tyrosine-type recombinase/integrase [Pseudomonadota bacterium]
MQLDDASQEQSSNPSDAKPRAPSWRAELNDNYCKLRKLDHPPVGYGVDGKLAFAAKAVPNPEGYIVWDISRDAPPGFGLKVGKRKTYILRRKVLGKSMLSKVGNLADFDKIQDARAKAGELARTMVETGQNPNALAREANAAEVTLKQAMMAYREHLTTRTVKPAKVETLKVYDRVMKRHDEWKWSDRKVREISDKEIKGKFGETNKVTPTATEQAFRWPSRAIDWYIENEKIRADAQNRDPTLRGNPFKTLAINGHYRSKEMIDAERDEKGKRNPLRPTQDLGRFLEACWSKKDTNDNMTGIHYIMLMLLWGCRKSEHAGLVWGELLTEVGGPGIGRRSTSHVWLKEHPDWGPYVFFYKTKNGRNHRMPIPPMTLALLKRRQGVSADEAVRRGFGATSRKFVFPARSKFSKTGHYMDATDLLDDLREEIGVERLNRHDLRRSFGAVMTAIQVPEGIKSRFLNHAHSNVTDVYTQAEWELLREWMTKIEQSILVRAPNIYNSLKAAEWPPIPAPEPHVCRPPKARTGRPSKAAKEAKALAEAAKL